MNIDFIKWMVGYAKGFEMDELAGYAPYVEYHFNDEFIHKYIVSKISFWYLYGLLLQRAIEGIETNQYIEILAYWNKSGKCYESQVFRTESDFPTLGVTYTDFKSIDEAKEATLKYIWEQEKK